MENTSQIKIVGTVLKSLNRVSVLMCGNVWFTYSSNSVNKIDGGLDAFFEVRAVLLANVNVELHVEYLLAPFNCFEQSEN